MVALTKLGVSPIKNFQFPPGEREILPVGFRSYGRNDFFVLGHRGHSSPRHLILQNRFVDHDSINWAVGRLRDELAAPKVFQLKIE